MESSEGIRKVVVEQMVLVCHEPSEFARAENAWYRIRWGIDQHASFELRRELLLWLSDRRLRLSRSLPPRGERAVIRVLGGFTIHEHETARSFGIVQGRPVGDNTYGQRGRAIACEIADGTVALHVLLPRQEHVLQEQAVITHAGQPELAVRASAQMTTAPIDLEAYIEAQSKRPRSRAY